MKKPTVHVAREKKTAAQAHAIKEAIVKLCGSSDAGVFAPCPECNTVRCWLKNEDGTIR